MAMTSADQQQIGRLSAQVEGLSKSVDKLDARIGGMESELKVLTEPIIKARGGYAALAWLIGAAAAAGALISNVINIWLKLNHGG